MPDPRRHAQGYADGGAGDPTGRGTVGGRGARGGATGADPDVAGTSEDAPEEGGHRRRLDLNLPQVAGSAVAAVVAAKFAANLGVYGTILGAGLVSAIATCGGPLFQHFFRRTGEQIRVAASQAKPRARQVPVPRQQDGFPVPATFRSEMKGETAPGGLGDARALTTVTPRAQDRPPHGQDVDPWAPRGTGGGDRDAAAGGDAWDPSAVPGTGTADTAATGGSPAAGARRDDITLLLRRAMAQRDAQREHGPPLHPGAPAQGVAMGSGVPGEYGEPSEEYSEGTVHHARVRGLKRPLIAAGLVFAVTMGGITGYELVSGHSLGGGTAGTTIGNVFGGGHPTARHTPATPPATPTDRPSDSAPSGQQPDQDTGSPTPGTEQPQDRGTTPTPGETDGSGTGSGSGGTGSHHHTPDPGNSPGQDQPTSPATPTPTPSQDGGTSPDTGKQGSTTQDQERPFAPTG
ncbi:hypothetical protein [Streptomyces sp. TS71-3]|uniref:hypothetical protein n=1 Tax=Streptomyces sp. TS71-3 TaxID=2733862 RepID=UPI001BB3CDB9|nr:hypothetical protein [Streptomyces sp. TS71-3]